jgi:hypothetical protein
VLQTGYMLGKTFFCLLFWLKVHYAWGRGKTRKRNGTDLRNRKSGNGIEGKTRKNGIEGKTRKNGIEGKTRKRG